MSKVSTTIVAVFSILTGLSSAVFASDWVEDEGLNGFYNHQVNKNSTPSPDPNQYSPQTTTSPYRSLSDGDSDSQEMQSGSRADQSSVFDTTEDQSAAESAGLYSPLTVPPSPPQYQGNAPEASPGKKSFLGNIGNFGKSVARFPAEAVEGAGAALSSPLFWQSAGALAGAGANTYMNYQYMKNNPGLYNNPYYGGMGYGGYNPYYGGGYPGYGIGGGYVNPYGGYSTGLGYGGYGGYGNLGGYGYNPYFSNRAYLPGTALNSLGRYAPQTPANQFLQNSYNNSVNNSGLSNYDKYWLKQNPNPGLFGY